MVKQSLKLFLERIIMDETKNFQEFKVKLLKPVEVAEILNISRSMSYRIIQTGQIRSVSIGNAKRVRPVDLIDFIDKTT